MSGNDPDEVVVGRLAGNFVFLCVVCMCDYYNNYINNILENMRR